MEFNKDYKPIQQAWEEKLQELEEKYKQFFIDNGITMKDIVTTRHGSPTRLDFDLIINKNQELKEEIIYWKNKIFDGY